MASCNEVSDRQKKLDKIKEKIVSELRDLTISSDEVTKKVFKIEKNLQKIKEILPIPDVPDVIYDWDQYFMSIACLAALRSKDPSTPVGACIVNSDKRVVGIGYNSMPYIKDCNNDDGIVFPWKGKSGKPFKETRYDYDKKLLYVVHAAVNAIINRTTQSLKGCTIYLTLKPDRDCAHAIIQAGISTVKYGKFIKPGREDQPDITGATELLHHGEVNLVEYIVKKEPAVHIYSDKKVISLSKRMKKVTPKEEKPDYIKWEQFFMAVAMLSKKKQGRHERSRLSTQGACIVSKDKKVISIGYSGYPEQMNYRAVNEETDMDYYAGDPYICHAEYDAILSTGTPSVKDCILYVTKYPCNDCAKVIIQSGIKEVVYVPDNDTPQDDQQPYTLEELIEETDQKEQTKKKKRNMYLGSKRILTECLVQTPPQKKKKENEKGGEEEGGGRETVEEIRGEEGEERVVEEGELSHQDNSKNSHNTMVQEIRPLHDIDVILHNPGVIVEMFCATDQEQMFDVSRDGIKIVVPPSAVPKDARIDVYIHLLSSGTFILPTDCQPISCFYWIQCSHKFSRQVEAHLQHYAELSDDDSKDLDFIVSCSTESSLPYQFEYANKDNNTTFPVGSKHGVIHTDKINESTIFAVVWKKTKPKFSNDFRYIWMVYHQQIKITIWELHVVVTKDLEPFKQRVKGDYNDWTEYIEPKNFQFGKDNYIQIENWKDFKQKNWRVIVARNKINKFDVDESTLDSSIQYLQLYIKLDESVEIAKLPDPLYVTLQGMRERCTSFVFIARKTTLSIEPYDASQYERFDNKDTYKKPEMQDLISFGIIKKISKKWKFISNMLQMSDKELTSIEKAHSAEEDCCKEMFSKWTQFCSVNCTWKTILVALATIGEQSLAEDIALELDKRANSG